MSDPQNTATPPPEDWRAMRREEKWQRRQGRREMRWGQGAPWIGGLILIGLGLMFLLQNFGVMLPHNWWAIFLLVPAAFAFSGAWSTYQNNGHEVTTRVRGALIGGAILTLLAITFFLGFDLGKFWPVILIVIGLAVLGGGNWRR